MNEQPSMPRPGSVTADVVEKFKQMGWDMPDEKIIALQRAEDAVELKQFLVIYVEQIKRHIVRKSIVEPLFEALERGELICGFPQFHEPLKPHPFHTGGVIKAKDNRR